MEGAGRRGLLRPRADDLRRLLRAEPIHRLFHVDAQPFAEGRFACVRRCRARASGRVFAAKFAWRAREGDDCSAELRHEVAALALCAPCPRVVALFAVFETPTHLVMVLEYAPGGDLQAVLDGDAVPFEADGARFVRQLLEALVFLHARRLAHLDIKPQNLVLTDEFPRGDVKLCDFEVSRVISEREELREILGTPDYVAPEILHYEPITLAADMWSLGVTAYVLLTGFSPFGGDTDQETFCNIARAQLDFPAELFDGVSADAVAFVRALLVRDPRARPSAAESLRHPWLRRGGGRRQQLLRLAARSTRRSALTLRLHRLPRHRPLRLAARPTWRRPLALRLLRPRPLRLAARPTQRSALALQLHCLPRPLVLRPRRPCPDPHPRGLTCGRRRLTRRRARPGAGAERRGGAALQRGTARLRLQPAPAARGGHPAQRHGHRRLARPRPAHAAQRHRALAQRSSRAVANHTLLSYVQ